ncbi:hypothetical protein TorRG33x02_311690, partial [Trema orientale]
MPTAQRCFTVQQGTSVGRRQQLPTPARRKNANNGRLELFVADVVSGRFSLRSWVRWTRLIERKLQELNGEVFSLIRSSVEELVFPQVSDRGLGIGSRPSERSSNRHLENPIVWHRYSSE